MYWFNYFHVCCCYAVNMIQMKFIDPHFSTVLLEDKDNVTNDLINADNSKFVMMHV